MKALRNDKPISRKEAIQKFGKYAAYTAPVMLVLFASKKKAYAGSLPEG